MGLDNIQREAEYALDCAQDNSEAACDARAAREDARQAQVDAKAERFTGAFLGKMLSEITGFTFRNVYHGGGFVSKTPGTVADIAIDALECGMSAEEGISILLTALQLCARKGDVDALRAVGTLAQAWGTQQVESAS